jgi:3-phosphoshikimate 1-carboxyvinyltransferase
MKRIPSCRNQEVAIVAPPAKAYTLRALFLSALAQGRSTIQRPLLGDDQQHAMECLRRLGISISCGPDEIAVEGRGGRFLPTGQELDVGESGVTMNFLTTLTCLCERPVVITGTSRIMERPIQEIVEGLRQLGCRIDYLGKEGFPPVRAHGGGIPGGQARLRGDITSQYFSAIAVAAPFARRPVRVQCLGPMTERPYLSITLSMMADFGVVATNRDFQELLIPNEAGYHPRMTLIEGDYSSAAFFFEAAAICRMRVTVTGLKPDSIQGDRRMLELLKKMGCRVTESERAVTLEGATLHGIETDMADTPDLVPPVAVAAAFAQGTTRLTGVGHLRHKECDRLAVIVSELAKMGIRASCDGSTLTVCGGTPRAARIAPHNDHRIAMSFAVAGLALDGQEIEDEGCVAKSFPQFWQALSEFV